MGEAPAGEEAAAQAEAEKVRVLICDDEESIRDLVSLCLRDAGMDCLPVPDGEAALATIDAYHPDVLLLDMMLPRADGWQVGTALAAMKKRGVWTGKVVVMTAGWRAEDAARDIGADSYLRKPFKLAELEQRVTSVLALPSVPDRRDGSASIP